MSDDRCHQCDAKLATPEDDKRHGGNDCAETPCWCESLCWSSYFWRCQRKPHDWRSESLRLRGDLADARALLVWIEARIRAGAAGHPTTGDRIRAFLAPKEPGR